MPRTPLILFGLVVLLVCPGGCAGSGRDRIVAASESDVPELACAAPDPLRRDPLSRDPLSRDPLSRDVLLLRSEDFVERTRAARRLVDAGAAALPALGEAGEAKVTEPGGQEVSTTRPVLDAIMRELPLPGLERHLAAPWPVVRRASAEELGRRRGWTPVPALVDRLGDADPAVRAEAASSLRRLTNRFFGYDARADVRTRDRAALRWREWWTIEGRVRAERGR